MPENLKASPHRLKLGVFGANCASGLAMTTVPERWKPTWQNNRDLALLCDQGGLDFMLPVARFKPLESATSFQGENLETITWAGGLLAVTRRINVVVTLHVPVFHPVMAAKQLATISQIGEGRLGVNIVCGWNAAEFAMFGLKLPEHDVGYEQGEE